MHNITIINTGCECTCGFSHTSVAGGEGSRMAYLHAREHASETACVNDRRTKTDVEKVMPTNGTSGSVKTLGQLARRQG